MATYAPTFLLIPRILVQFKIPAALFSLQLYPYIFPRFTLRIERTIVCIDLGALIGV